MGCVGDDGTDAASDRMLTSMEAPGANCPNGGIKIESGPDLNGDGVLDGDEVAQVQYVCSGANGEGDQQPFEVFINVAKVGSDVAADAARDHIYIPGEDLHFFGVTEADIKALKPTRPIRDLLRYQVSRTRALYDRGRPLLSRLGNDLRLELALIWLIGTAIFMAAFSALAELRCSRLIFGSPVSSARKDAMVTARPSECCGREAL